MIKKENYNNNNKNKHKPCLLYFEDVLFRTGKYAISTVKCKLILQSLFLQSQSQKQLLPNFITILIHSHYIDSSAKKRPLISKID